MKPWYNVWLNKSVLLAQTGLTRKRARNILGTSLGPISLLSLHSLGRHRPLLIEANRVIMEFPLTLTTFASAHLCVPKAVGTSHNHECRA
jgi:hypothetical protein